MSGSQCPEDAPADVRIRRALRTIVESWPDMVSVLAVRPAGPQVRQAPGSRAPASVDVLSMRRWSCEVLASWVILVLDDASDHPKATISGHDAPVMCRYLARWADFLAAHEAAADAVAELEAIASGCETVAQDLRKRRFSVGQCIGHTEDDTGARVPCTGTIHALLSDDQKLLPVLRCDAQAGHVWDGSTWHDLSRMPVTVADAARISRVPERTIRSWIAQGSVVPVAGDRPALVRLADVTRRATVE